MNTITVSITENSGSKRAVTINNDMLHYIDEAEIQALLNKADETWQYDPGRAAALGTGLFTLVNGAKNKLRTLISQKLPEGDIHLILNTHKDLDSLHFEMMYDNRFISLESHVHIIYRRAGLHFVLYKCCVL